ncbi:MAG: hypothetical protein IJS09_08570 [Treponema sp.]|nr:hypothetical protein [Treponema sp.]
MGFFQAIIEFLESVFKSNSPEVRKRNEIRKIEAEIKSFQPNIYKNNLFTPNFGEIFRVLYENTKPLGDILMDTICNEDVQRAMFFEQQLLLTGFSEASQEKLENLSYENRKQEVLNSNQPMTDVLRVQRQRLESLAKELSTPDFLKIDEIIASLHQLEDICRYNYMSVIHTFDPEYMGENPSYTPSFQPAIPETLAGSLQDLYYVSARQTLSSSTVRALCALDEVRKGRALTSDETKQINMYFRKINAIFTRILNAEMLKKLICIAKKDPEANPQIATYKPNARQKYADFMEKKFFADEKKLKVEIKDITISAEIQKLFGAKPLEPIMGYNNENNENLQQNTPAAFTWITPVQIVKTFIKYFLNEPIMALLNDIVIEGFFNNNAAKTDFSTDVFSAGEIPNEIDTFEKSFSRNAPNDIAILEGFIRDSHKDPEFLTRLSATVDTINKQAHNLIQNATKKLYTLYVQINEMLTDSKKTSPDTITNIKVLLNSSRNRDAAEQLELHFEMWKVFLEIMKNYVLIGDVEKKA